MNKYKLKVGFSDLDKNLNERTIHIYNNYPVYFFTDVHHINKKGVIYHLCINKELYRTRDLPISDSTNPYIYHISDLNEEIDVALNVLEKLNTYEGTVAKKFIEILNELINERIFKSN